jgi:hypothetical protein
VLRHLEEVSGNVAACRYYGISRGYYYRLLRRVQADGLEGPRDRSRRPQHSSWTIHIDTYLQAGSCIYASKIA